jgi:hypothetical protein
MGKIPIGAHIQVMENIKTGITGKRLLNPPDTKLAVIDECMKKA